MRSRTIVLVNLGATERVAIEAAAASRQLRVIHVTEALSEWANADMGVRGPIERLELGALPPTLPYRPAQFHAEFADLMELPLFPTEVQPHDLFARRYLLELRDLDGTTVRLHTEVRGPDLAHQRISIGWKGATPADQTLIDTVCQGDLQLCPDPGAVNVVPVVKHDGVEITAGTAPLALGSTVRVFIAQVDALVFAFCDLRDPATSRLFEPCYLTEQTPVCSQN